MNDVTAHGRTSGKKFAEREPPIYYARLKQDPEAWQAGRSRKV
jgi:hypothetical protein